MTVWTRYPLSDLENFRMSHKNGNFTQSLQKSASQIKHKLAKAAGKFLEMKENLSTSCTNIDLLS